MSRLSWLPLFPSLAALPLLLHLLSFFSECMTNSKEIPNCGHPKPAAPPPAFSWQDGSCLTFNHECLASKLGLREPEGDSVGGTKETRSGKAGSIQLNLSIKAQSSGPNSSIIGRFIREQKINSRMSFGSVKISTRLKKQRLFQEVSIAL